MPRVRPERNRMECVLEVMQAIDDSPDTVWVRDGVTSSGGSTSTWPGTTPTSRRSSSARRSRITV